MYTSSTSVGSTSQLARAALAATWPKCGAVKFEMEPMKEPIGVRLAPTMTVECGAVENNLFENVLANITFDFFFL